jgi:hypothetical protein
MARAGVARPARPPRRDPRSARWNADAYAHAPAWLPDAHEDRPARPRRHAERVSLDARINEPSLDGVALAVT